MIWDADSYIVHEVGPIAIQVKSTVRLAKLPPGYRENVRKTYQRMLVKQHASWEKRRGAKG